MAASNNNPFALRIALLILLATGASTATKFLASVKDGHDPHKVADELLQASLPNAVVMHHILPRTGILIFSSSAPASHTCRIALSLPAVDHCEPDSVVTAV